MVPQNTHSFKRRAQPCDHQKPYICVNLHQKGPEIMHIWLAKYQIFLGKGRCHLATPKSYSSVKFRPKMYVYLYLCIYIYIDPMYI